MDEIIISDNMKKESKMALTPLIGCAFLAIVVPLVEKLTPFFNDYSNKDLILWGVSFGIFALFFLYGYLYAIKYNVTVTKEKIQLKTLFRKLEVNMADITEYTCKRYMKSAFYQFKILYLDKKVVINTRYYQEFDKLLKEVLSSR